MKREYRSRPRDEATERIECYILQQQLPAHSKLPSERDMCQMWNLNRSTLRGAINRLLVEGKLYNRRGSGTYVAPPKMMRNLQDNKSSSQSIRDEDRELETIELNKCVVECNKSLAKKLHLVLGTKVFLLRRLRIMDGEPVIIESAYVDYNRFPGIDKVDFNEESFYQVLERYGVKAEQGRETIGVTYANPEEAQLLRIEENTPLFYLTGLSHKAGGEPVEYFKSVVRSDKVRFVSVLTNKTGD